MSLATELKAIDADFLTKVSAAIAAAMSKADPARIASGILSQAYRLHTFAETLLASFAQANIPYAVEILLLLQLADLLIARALAHFATAISTLARWFARHDPALPPASTQAILG